MKLILAAFGLLLVASQQFAQTPCRKAADDDHPHGANEIIEYRGMTMRQLRGVVMEPSGKAVPDVVLELYSYNDAEKSLLAHRIAGGRTRIMATLTGEKGVFCFRDLRSGRYVVRIGTRYSDGFEEAFVKIRLDRHWWSRWLRRKRLQVVLQLGT
jgi:hypothetical protein